MRVATALLLGLAAPSIALACPGKGDTTTASAHVDAASPDAASCAKKAALVGSACSYSTGMMASRVLEQGKSFEDLTNLPPALRIERTESLQRSPPWSSR